MEWWLYHDAMMVGREQRCLHLVWVGGKRWVGVWELPCAIPNKTIADRPYHTIWYQLYATTRYKTIPYDTKWVYQLAVTLTHTSKKDCYRENAVLSCVWSNHNYTPIALEPSRHVGVWEIMSPTYLPPRSGLHSSPCRADSIFNIIWSNFQPCLNLSFYVFSRYLSISV